MNITVTFKHMDSSDAVRNYAQTKISKLEKYLNNILEAHLTLSMERIAHKGSGIASIKITGRNLDLNALEKSDDIYSAIDLLMEKVEAQIKKHKEKARRKETLRNNQETYFEGRSAGPVSSGDLSDLGIEMSDDFERKPLSLEEALNKLRKKKRDFLIFKDKATSKVSFLIKSEEGYSLTQPDL